MMRRLSTVEGERPGEFGIGGGNAMPTNGAGRGAEFDELAEAYHECHKANVAITGEDPAFFAQYKIADLAALVRDTGAVSRHIVDFGSGIGNTLPFFRRDFGASRLTCAEVSARSMQIARARFPGPERYVHVGSSVPLPDASQDLAFSACVFHHIPHQEHCHWLAELARVVRPGGWLAIYEHNPLNPLTVHAVRTCPLDANARLVRAGVLRRRAWESGWRDVRIEYKLFFPAALAKLRPLERHLHWLPLGAQYRLTARRPG